MEITNKDDFMENWGCCNHNGGVGRNCFCYRNNKALICSSLVALILLNTLDDDCLCILANFLVSTGDLLLTGKTMGSCH